MNPEEQSSAKRQAYSFNFPPDKKEKFSALARSMNRPMAWLLLEAIDRMIESGGTYPSNTPAPNPSDDVLEAYVSKSGMSEVLEGYMRVDDVHSAIDKAITPIQIDLAELLQQVNGLRAGMDGKSPKIKTPNRGPQSSASEVEVQKWVKRCEAEPALRAAIEEGLGQNLTGKALVDWVFSKGFGANENAKPFDSSVAGRMRGAIEHLKTLSSAQ